MLYDYGESTRRPLAITTSVFSLQYYTVVSQWWSTDPTIVSDSIGRTLMVFFTFFFNSPNDPGLLEMILRATMLPYAGLLFITL